MPDENVMDAVNAALEDDAVAPEPVEEIETPEGEAEGDESAPEGETEGDEPEGEAEPETGPNGERERNPDGTWKANAEKKDKPVPEPKKADPVNDPIPRDLKKETQERIRTLIDTTKTVTAERDAIKQDFDYLIKGVEATGATPQQYGETLSWLALFNSNDPKQQEKALELVETVAERLATFLGKDRSVRDPLQAHPDLVQAVQSKQITPEYAKEIARTRNGQQFRTEITTQASQEQQAQQQAQNELATARNDLNLLEQSLAATDPDYALKKATLVPVLKPVFAAIPPSQWKAKFTEAYRNLRVNAPAAKAKTGVPANQPLRNKQPAGGQRAAPASMLDAINGALSGMK
jgi:hypothetical protein